MLNPNEKQQAAMHGIFGTSAQFTEEYIQYLEDDRDYERNQLESAPPHEMQVIQGRCQKLTDQINDLKSLVARRGS